MSALMVMDELVSETAPATTAEATTEATTQPLDFEMAYREGYPATLRRAQALLHGGNRGRAAGATTEFAGDGWLPEDIAQEVWARLWKHWGRMQYLPLGQVMGSARQATDRLIIDRYRYRQMAAQHGRTRLNDDGWVSLERTVAAAGSTDFLDDDAEPACGQPEAATVWRETVAELRVVAHHDGRLTGRTGQTCRDDARRNDRFVMTYRQRNGLFEALLTGESPRVTAARLGMSEGSVKTHQWRLRLRLRAYLVANGVAAASDTEAGAS